MRKNDRVGEISYNRFGRKMKIIEYNSADDIVIEWLDGSGMTRKAQYQKFKEGAIKNPYDKTVHGIGFLGIGEYTNDKYHILNKKAYNTWKGLFDRCYKQYNISRNYVYAECTVCEEWHNFQNFAKWYDENYYEIEGNTMCLDKDILVKGNKVYSPDTCIFVPQEINKTFTKTDKLRGKHPIGVCVDKNGIAAHCNYGKKRNKFLGYFKTEEKAFNAYKQFKEFYIKQLAEEYKKIIPKKLYEAMYNYKVDIND